MESGYDTAVTGNETTREKILGARLEFGEIMNRAMIATGMTTRNVWETMPLPRRPLYDFVLQAQNGKGAPPATIDAIVEVMRRECGHHRGIDEVDFRRLHAVAGIAKQPLTQSAMTAGVESKPAKPRRSPAIPKTQIQEVHAVKRRPVTPFVPLTISAGANENRPALCEFAALLTDACRKMDISPAHWTGKLSQRGVSCTVADFEKIRKGTNAPSPSFVRAVVDICQDGTGSKNSAIDCESLLEKGLSAAYISKGQSRAR